MIFMIIANLQHCFVWQAEEGQCIWYGECENTPSGKINCQYNGPPKVMEDPVGMDILQTYCPDLVTGKVELDKSMFILQLVNLPLQSLLTIYIGEEAKKTK